VSYLLDTNVLSETRKRVQDQGVAEWISTTPADQLCVSVLTLGEIEQGVARVRARGDRRQASALDRWLRELEVAFAGRIMSVTIEVARDWGRHRLASPVPVIDALIGATARVHGQIVVTRNVRDFEHNGVRVLNPFS
jgi:toxin FitB